MPNTGTISPQATVKATSRHETPLKAASTARTSSRIANSNPFSMCTGIIVSRLFVQNTRHRVFGWTVAANLKVVVHHGERVETERIGGTGDVRDVLTGRHRPVGIVKGR
jgi:hypothetical protein